MKLRVLLPLLLFTPVLYAQDARVVVMTSYPQELIARYETAFETAHPEIDLVIEWRRSGDARQLLLAPEGQAIDVYWAPTLDTFVELADQDYFAPLPLPYAGLPGRIGALAIDDPQKRFAAFEVAGFGFAYSQSWLDAKGLSVPTDWKDLTDASYLGALQLPVPSRQGFSPMIYESILHGYGWDEGWRTITEIAGNGALMDGGGGSFIDQIAAGSTGIALTIDFFPKGAQANGAPVGFRYADTTLFSPAYVAKMAKAPHADNADVFIDFALSDAGQTLLLHRDVARLPVRPSAYPAAAEYNPFTMGDKSPAFDFTQAGAHLNLLAALFDVQVTNRHEELVAALAKLRAAEAAAGSNAAAQANVAKARELLLAPPLGAMDADKVLGSLASGSGIPAAPTDPLPVQAWAQILSERMDEALALLGG